MLQLLHTVRITNFDHIYILKIILKNNLVVHLTDEGKIILLSSGKTVPICLIFYMTRYFLVISGLVLFGALKTLSTLTLALQFLLK